ncbi:MAG TPA: type II secretion system protein GspM [Polyangia bacterium]|jgi:type II secretory pathway component PulM|nr:type II secretion system protein GspM [Polyangia bacterium]
MASEGIPILGGGRLRARWERLTERERRLLLAFFSTLIVLVVGATILVINNGLTTLESENDEIRQALRDIDGGREAYQRAKAKTASIEVRMGSGNVQLQGFLEQGAKEAGVEISETTERQPVPVGKKYLERAVDLRLRKVTVEQLAKFLRYIETGPNLVVVTSLNVRTRDDRHEDLEVEMAVATYEHAPADRPGRKKDNKEEKG